jgi:hypothetical protein
VWKWLLCRGRNDHISLFIEEERIKAIKHNHHRFLLKSKPTVPVYMDLFDDEKARSLCGKHKQPSTPFSTVSYTK